MTGLVAILLGVVLVNQFVLGRFPVLFPQPVSAALMLRLSCVNIAALALAGPPAWWLEQRALAAAGLPQLAFVGRVLVVATCVKVLRTLAASAPRMWGEDLDRHRNLLTFNAMSVALALAAARPAAGPLQAAMDGVLAGLLLGALLHFTAHIARRLEYADVPQSLRGASIALITAAIASMAFTGLEGLWRG